MFHFWQFVPGTPGLFGNQSTLAATSSINAGGVGELRVVNYCYYLIESLYLLLLSH